MGTDPTEINRTVLEAADILHLDFYYPKPKHFPAGNVSGLPLAALAQARRVLFDEPLSIWTRAACAERVEIARCIKITNHKDLRDTDQKRRDTADLIILL